MPHPWLQNIHEKARCPHCGKIEFRRSRARNLLEEFRKEHSMKRPYRCHACNYRAWIDPVKLSFDYEQSEGALPAEENPLPVPSIDLDDATEPAIPDSEAPLPRTELEFADTAPVVSPEDRENNNGWHYHIEFNPDDIKSVRTRKSTVDFIPRDRQSRHGRKCPVCGRSALFRSHCRNLFERIRKNMTSRRAYRCHNCDWRGWLS